MFIVGKGSIWVKILFLATCTATDREAIPLMYVGSTSRALCKIQIRERKQKVIREILLLIGLIFKRLKKKQKNK